MKKSSNQVTITKREWITGGVSAVALVCMMGACVAGMEDTTSSASSYRSTPDVDSMSFRERRQMLTTYRSNSEMCISPSVDCKFWTGLALKCELGYSGSPCTRAEAYREQVTGIEVSSAPKAFVF